MTNFRQIWSHWVPQLSHSTFLLTPWVFISPSPLFRIGGNFFTPEWLAPVYLLFKMRTKQWDQIWRNFATLVNFLSILNAFSQQNFKPTLTQILCKYSLLLIVKYWKINCTFGHTGSKLMQSQCMPASLNNRKQLLATFARRSSQTFCQLSDTYLQFVELVDASGAVGKTEENVGPWWWSSGQRVRLLLWRSELESRWCQQFYSVKFVFEKTKINKKEAGVVQFF